MNSLSAVLFQPPGHVDEEELLTGSECHAHWDGDGLSLGLESRCPGACPAPIRVLLEGKKIVKRFDQLPGPVHG